MIDIVIVNWNSGHLLRECIDSMRLSTLKPQSITIVDNNSTDSSLSFLDETVRLVRSKSNLGFGKACNLGAANGSAKYILFLNPDARLFEVSLSQSLAFLEYPLNAQVGICGVQLLDNRNVVARSCSRFPTPASFFSHSAALSKFFPRLGHSMVDWHHAINQDVDQVIGAFFLVRRSLFIDLGGFDERFFVYYEELDFSYRARLAGWRSVYLADVQAFHAGGGTSNQVKAKRLFYSLRSRILYAFKHFSLPGALLVLLSTLLIEPFSRCIFAIVRRSRSSFNETLYGYAMLIQWLPQWVFKGVTR
jgi:GT2 family glycosyltransferase